MNFTHFVLFAWTKLLYARYKLIEANVLQQARLTTGCTVYCVEDWRKPGVKQNWQRTRLIWTLSSDVERQVSRKKRARNLVPDDDSDVEPPVYQTPKTSRVAVIPKKVSDVGTASSSSQMPWCQFGLVIIHNTYALYAAIVCYSM